MATDVGKLHSLSLYFNINYCFKMLSHDKIVHLTAACSDELDEIGENGHLIHLCS